MSRSTFSGPINSTAGFEINGVAINSTAAELNVRNDDSAMEESITSGACSVTIPLTKFTLPGAGAITLAAPTKPCFMKVIRMEADNGDVTLSLANCVGGTAATTCTFNDANDRLVLMSDSAASGKWIILKEHGVALT